MSLAMIKHHQYQADGQEHQQAGTQRRDARRVAICPADDLLQAEDRGPVLVNEFDDTAAATGDAGHWVIRDDDG